MSGATTRFTLHVKRKQSESSIQCGSLQPRPQIPRLFSGRAVTPDTPFILFMLRKAPHNRLVVGSSPTGPTTSLALLRSRWTSVDYSSPRAKRLGVHWLEAMLLETPRSGDPGTLFA